MNKPCTHIFFWFCLLVLAPAVISCKQKKLIRKNETTAQETDSLIGKCRLEFKTARGLSKQMKENEFKFDWINAKASVETLIEGKEENFDIRLKIRRDSAILVSIQYALGLEVAKILITKDTVTLVNYIQKTYFRGDFNYINELLHAEIDYDVLQAILFGNSAEFHDEETKLKPVADRQNCLYLLSTERKRRLRRIQNGVTDLKTAMQTLTIRPDNYKIIRNEFIEPASSRRFTGTYKNFTLKDSVYAPYHVDIEIEAQKKALVKIDYVRIEKNKPQKMGLNIPSKYEAIEIKRK